MKIKTKKILNRSGTYSCEICREKAILVTHHINGRNIPDANKEYNLVSVCDICHRKIHENIIIVEKWCSSTSGMELMWHNKDEESLTGQSSTPYIIPRKN